MPAWVVQIIIAAAENVGTWKAILTLIQDILSHIRNQPDPTVAIQNVRDALAPIGVGPELKGQQ